MRSHRFPIEECHVAVGIQALDVTEATAQDLLAVLADEGVVGSPGPRRQATTARPGCRRCSSPPPACRRAASHGRARRAPARDRERGTASSWPRLRRTPRRRRESFRRRRHAPRPHARRARSTIRASGRRRRHPRRAPQHPLRELALAGPTSSTRRGAPSATAWTPPRVHQGRTTPRSTDAHAAIRLPSSYSCRTRSGSLSFGPQGSRIGVPERPLRGAFPLSQAFTVAPTSPNSPSWMWPAAFLPWTYASRSPYSRE